MGLPVKWMKTSSSVCCFRVTLVMLAPIFLSPSTSSGMTLAPPSAETMSVSSFIARDNFTVVYYGDVVAERLSLFHVVSGKEYRQLVDAAEFLQKLPDDVPR